MDGAVAWRIVMFGKKTIAKIVIEGTIEDEGEKYSQKWLLGTIKKLEDKDDVIGLILYIDSPGGGVFQSDEVYLAVQHYISKTAKPVFAYFASLAASGGYYIGCSADRIVANRNTLTGSIGVICGRFLDVSEFINKHGIKDEIIHSGRNKTMGHIATPATEEQKAIMQRISDECYEQFVSIVAEARNLPIEKVKELADGRIYTAKQAKECGLIDEIMPFDDMKEYMLKTIGKEDEKASIVEYKFKGKKSVLQKMLKGQASASSEMISSYAKAKTPYPAYYFDAERFGR